MYLYIFMHLDTSPCPPSFGHAAGIGTGTENGSVEKNTSRHSARQVEAWRKRRHSARFFQPNHGHFMRPFVSWLSAGSTVQPTSASKTLASGVSRVYINHFTDFQRFPCSTAIWPLWGPQTCYPNALDCLCHVLQLQTTRYPPLRCVALSIFHIRHIFTDISKLKIKPKTPVLPGWCTTVVFRLGHVFLTRLPNASWLWHRAKGTRQRGPHDYIRHLGLYSLYSLSSLSSPYSNLFRIFFTTSDQHDSHNVSR